MCEKVYGYVRVSTKEQNEARQIIAMNDFGIPANCIYVDSHSGKNFERPAYKSLFYYCFGYATFGYPNL